MLYFSVLRMLQYRYPSQIVVYGFALALALALALAFALALVFALALALVFALALCPELEIVIFHF